MLNPRMISRFFAQGTNRSQSDPTPLTGIGKLTLRMKGIIGFVALVAYIAVAGVLIAQQREALLHNVQELEQIHARQDALTKVSSSLAHAVTEVNAAYYEVQVAPRFDNIAIDVEAVQAGLHALTTDSPALTKIVERINQNITALRAMPVRSGLLGLRDNMHVLVGELDTITRGVSERRKILSDAYRIAYNSITVIALTMGMAGIILFGSVTALFFSRLARDLNTLEKRARQVVKGYRGEPLPVTRHDEVGGLMKAVNQMQSDLRNHEQQLEIVRQQRFHQERMAAVGSLAAAIAHEINNPIAAITGATEEMCRTQRQGLCSSHGNSCSPDLVLEQAQRIARITRQISDLTAPQSAQSQLMDVNGLLRSTGNFLCYDQRLRETGINYDLDNQLPALLAVPDEITQIAVNLLINAADAIAAVPGLHGRIDLSTRVEDHAIVIAVADNGCGMSEAACEHAFDEGFTTKSNGSGIGLFMCKSLAEAYGGTVEITSTPGKGTRVRVCLPFETETSSVTATG